MARPVKLMPTKEEIETAIGRYGSRRKAAMFFEVCYSTFSRWLRFYGLTRDYPQGVRK